MPHLSALTPPSWPAGVHRDAPDVLRRLYRAWLASPRPGEGVDRRVASSKNARAVARGADWAQQTQAAWQAARHTWDARPEGVWVWSDLHLGHANICSYAGRPFLSVEAMDAALLAGAQSTVQPDDWLLFLGDLSFRDGPATRAWLDACPGHKALVLGNHDGDARWARSSPDPRDLGFEAVAETVDWRLDAPLLDADGLSVDRLWLTHYPLWHAWIPPQTRCLHGHIHQHLIPGRLINVSVEHTRYRPALLRDKVSASSSRALDDADERSHAKAR